MSETFRLVRMVRRPEGLPRANDFEITEEPIPIPGPGQILIKNSWMAVAPSMRIRMSEKAGEAYMPAFELGEPLSGSAVGEVLASRSDRFSVGDTVLNHGAWQELLACDAGSGGWRDPRRVDASNGLHPRHFLGALGNSGFSAWVGLTKAAKIQPGDAVYVSAAAGGVGSVAIQLATAWGHRTVGSAGSRKKADRIVNTYGAAGAFNYRDGPVSEQLASHAPDGIDVYFDNVGGDHLEAAIASMNAGGRIALCGAVSTYNSDPLDSPGPRNLMHAVFKGLTLRGFLAGQFASERDAFLDEVSPLVKSGDVKIVETLYEGIEAAPTALSDLLTGTSDGKVLVRL